MIKHKYKYDPIVITVLLCLVLCSCQQKPTLPPLFEQLPSAQTNIHFVNRISDNERPGILDYLYYYNGGGVAVGDINNDGLPDIFFTANQKGGNKLYLNKGNYKFEDISQKAGIAGIADWSTGVTMADVNNDGYLDIYVCAVAGKLNLKGHNMLYINNHNGTFTERSAEYCLDFSVSCSTSLIILWLFMVILPCVKQKINWQAVNFTSIPIIILLM
jgi:hypothetical protein